MLLVNAVGLNLYRAGNFERPAAGIVVVAGMVAWTALAVWAYADPARRTAPLLLADLGVALATLLVSPLVKGADLNATVPGFWIAGALFAWAVHWRWQGGLVAAVLLCAVDLGIRDDVTQGNYGNVFLLLIGGAIVGFLSASLDLMATERDAAQRASIVAAERTRLARTVHDGVLQVLALVQRKGPELGGEGVALGRLAGEQESVLRALIREQDTLVSPSTEQTLDLASALARLERPASVSVATPGEEVLLPAATVTEVVAVVSACLDNVSRHVGEDAPAWVLLQAFPDSVEVSVRDEGAGIPPGRLAAAAAEGRMGVLSSIRGRVADLGGTAELVTGSFGTEWEIWVPRDGASVDPRVP